jgi:hypothetical protein
MIWLEVLTAVTMKISVFWVVAPCRLVLVYRRFRGPYFVIALMMEAVQISETSVNSYQSTRRYNPEDSHLQLNYCLIMRFILIFFSVSGFISFILSICGVSIQFRFVFASVPPGSPTKAAVWVWRDSWRSFDSFVLKFPSFWRLACFVGTRGVNKNEMYAGIRWGSDKSGLANVQLQWGLFLNDNKPFQKKKKVARWPRRVHLVPKM